MGNTSLFDQVASLALILYLTGESCLQDRIQRQPGIDAPREPLTSEAQKMPIIINGCHDVARLDADHRVDFSNMHRDFFMFSRPQVW